MSIQKNDLSAGVNPCPTMFPWLRKTKPGAPQYAVLPCF